MLLLVVLAASAYAHGVNVFTWVEGDTVFTTGKFSSGKKAVNSLVEVLDRDGRVLLTGKTDEKGEFSFKMPSTKPAKILLKAGHGHMGEWVLRDEDVAGAEVPESAVKHSGEAVAVNSQSQEALKAEIEAAVNNALDRKLRPVMAVLAELSAPGPSISDIIGGIGYIIGLVGLGAYLNSRKKQK